MLYLRAPTEKDEAEIRECYRRSVNLHQPWAYEPKDYSIYLAQTDRLFLCLQESHEIVGTFNISNIVRGVFSFCVFRLRSIFPSPTKRLYEPRSYINDSTCFFSAEFTPPRSKCSTG